MYYSLATELGQLAVGGLPVDQLLEEAEPREIYRILLLILIMTHLQRPSYYIFNCGKTDTHNVKFTILLIFKYTLQ